MLAYYLQEELNKELYHNCLPWGWEVPHGFQVWYQSATKVELDLME